MLECLKSTEKLWKKKKYRRAELGRQGPMLKGS